MVNKNVSRGKYANDFGSDEAVADDGRRRRRRRRRRRSERRTAALYFRRRILYAAPRQHWRARAAEVSAAASRIAPKVQKTPYTAAGARNNKALGPRITRIPTHVGGFRPVHSSGLRLLCSCGCTTVSDFRVPNHFENKKNASKNTQVWFTNVWGTCRHDIIRTCEVKI